MAVTGRTIEDIRQTLVDGFVGQTITGAGAKPLTRTLKAGDDPYDVMAAPRGCVDGGVIVDTPRTVSTGRTMPGFATGGRVQHECRTTFDIEVGLNVEGCTGNTLSANLTAWIRQLINLIEAALEPQSGQNENLSSRSCTHGRSPNNTGFVIFRLTCEVTHWWQR